MKLKTVRRVVWWWCLFCFLVKPAFAQDPASLADHRLVVEQVKQELLTRGYSFVIMDPPTDEGSEASRCSAFEITKRVAWRLRAEGIGLVAKAPGQKGCAVAQGRFSHDALMYPGGNTVDIIEASETKNEPAWNGTGAQPPANWRAPFDPGDTPVIPSPSPSPGPVATLDYERIKSIVHEEVLAATGEKSLLYGQSERTHGNVAKEGDMTQQFAAVRADIKAIDEKTNRFLGVVGDVLTFTGKYIAPAVGAWIAARKIGD